MIESDPIGKRHAIRWTALSPVLIASLWMLLGIAMWGHIMMRSIEPNEHMYVSASVLSMKHTIYDDFPFIQVPNLPYVYAVLYRLTGTEHYLFVARTATWAVTMLACGMVGAIAWQFAESQPGLQAVLAAWVLALSESTILITGECSNYVFPIFLSLVAFWALVALPIRFSCCLSGLMLALAVGFKLYYASLVPLFAIAILGLAGKGKERWLSLSAFLAFGALGGLPSILCVWRNPDAFLYNNIGFHLQTANWFREIQYHDRLSLFDKAQYAKACLQHPSQMWMAFGSVVVLIRCIQRDFRDWRWISLAASLVGMSIVTALIPTPIWPQYVGMIVPFVLVLVLAAGSHRLFAIEHGLLVCFLVGVVVSGPYYVRMACLAFQSKNWTPIAYHNETRAIVSAFEVDDDAIIATFMPLFVIEAGHDVEPEFVNARFLYQVSDALSDEFAAKIHTTSRSRLNAFLDAKRPDLMVTPYSRAPPGNASSPDDDLDRYASEHGYEKHEFANAQLTIWRWVEKHR